MVKTDPVRRIEFDDDDGDRPRTPDRRRTHADELRTSLNQFQRSLGKAVIADPTVTSRFVTFLRKPVETFKQARSEHEGSGSEAADEEVDEEELETIPIFKLGPDEYRLRTELPDELTFQPLVMWPKERRGELDAETRMNLIKQATGFVLSKNNKLSLPNFKTNDDGTLTSWSNVDHQVRTLHSWCVQWDMANVFTIILPVGDLLTSSKARSETFNLFLDYPRITDTMVANSNAYWRTWIGEPFVEENLQFTYEALRNNTEPSLWAKASEDYDEYPPIYRGGPLMFSLLLNRILNQTEDSLGHLNSSFKVLSVKGTPAEDVDIVVSIIKSTYRALKAASRPEKSFIPDDFVDTIFSIFQTSSVDAFNVVFRNMRNDIVVAADMSGTLPEWPTVSQLTSLATKTYHRLLTLNQWIAPVAPSALVGSVPTPSRPRGKCFNCGGDHLLPACTEPRDEVKIKAARDAFAATKTRPPGGRSGPSGGRFPGRGGGGGSGRPPKRTTAKGGKPMILNKQGVYVLDQKRWKAKQPPDSKSPPSPDEIFKSFMVPGQTVTVSTPSTAPTVPMSELTDSTTVSFTRASFAEALSRARLV